MDERTREYLAGRCGDHYRRVRVEPPPAAQRREWGYIPWKSDNGTTMVRHRSVTDLGGIGEFLVRVRPRHVYFSAGRYDDPGASAMGAKGWRSSDLIFDLDADHLPGVNPERDSYAEMLESCKRELRNLLDLLVDDFGFTIASLVFSGSRGYHVHIRETDVGRLNRRSRRDIVEYVRGEGIGLDTVLETTHVAGAGRSTPAPTRRLDPTGGWSRRVHREVLDYVAALRDAETEAALDQLQAIEGVGENRAQAILRAVNERSGEIEAGNVDIHPAFVNVLEHLVERCVSRQGAAIDEPVTTDINRLIRLPGSLHGGSGLAVCPLSMDELDDFDPLVDAIPSTFEGHEIAVEMLSSATSEVGDEVRELSPGPVRLPEYVAIHLMARGEAKKIPESSA